MYKIHHDIVDVLGVNGLFWDETGRKALGFHLISLLKSTGIKIVIKTLKSLI